MDVILLDLGLVILAAAFFGLVAHLLKQPPILGYILAGFLTSVFIPNQPATAEVLGLFSHLGVAFLLFILGVEMNINEVKAVGFIALVTGFGQVIITSVVGFFLAYYVLRYNFVDSSYIGVALTFSSTIIILKLLGERGDLNSLYGRISVGLLIVQDLIAILALIMLSSMGSLAGNSFAEIGAQLVRTIVVGTLLFLMIYISGRFLNIFLRYVVRSTEILLLVVVSWALIAATITSELGFSLEVGAFLAGLVLATSQYNVEIAAKVRPLRDFFITMFFVVLGGTLSLSGFQTSLPQIIVLSVLVIVGNPLILLAIMGALGYHRRISFMTGLTVSQISEFSLILVATGVTLGQVSPNILGVVTGVGVITFVSSSYLIHHGDDLYRVLSSTLKLFERRKLSRHVGKLSDSRIKVLLIGGDQMGKMVLQSLQEQDIDSVVVDFNPTVVRSLQKQGVNAVYADVSDSQVVDDLKFRNIEVIISTAPRLEDNLFLLTEARKIKQIGKPIIIVTARSSVHREILKAHGADHVIVPELEAGKRIVRVLSSTGHAILEKETN